MFGRFYRGMEVSGEEGVGIGLYLVRQIPGEGGYLKVTQDAARVRSFRYFWRRWMGEAMVQMQRRKGYWRARKRLFAGIEGY